MAIKTNLSLSFIIGNILFMLFPLNFYLLYAQSNSNIVNSKTIGRDLNNISKTVNNSNDTINKYGATTISLSNSNFQPKNSGNMIFNVTWIFLAEGQILLGH